MPSISTALGTIMMVGLLAASQAKAGGLTLKETGVITYIGAENSAYQPIVPPPGDIAVGDSYTVTATFDPSRAVVGQLFDADPTINIYSLPGTTVTFQSGSYVDSFIPIFDLNSSLQLWNNYTGGESGATLPPTDSQSFSFFNYESASTAFNVGAGQTSESLNLYAFDPTATARSNDLISSLVPFSRFAEKTFSYGVLNSTSGLFVDAQGTVTSETLTPSAVPEPSVWALLVLGLGGIGLVCRHANRKQPPQFNSANTA